jgi:BirA family biotin operon repressor/biotin-[acetyl-CoA-carboxylase] ligase
VISLAVLYCVQGFLPKSNVLIKWPNDIYVDYRKIAGILTKNSITGNKIGHTIVGIGINVNQMTFPADLPNPVSIKQLSELTVDIQSVLDRLMEFLGILYHKLEAGELGFINNQYLKNLLNMNQKAWYQQGNQVFEGTITGVSRYGRLQMEVDNEIREYDFKEITFLFKNISSQ